MCDNVQTYTGQVFYYKEVDKKVDKNPFKSRAGASALKTFIPVGDAEKQADYSESVLSCCYRNESEQIKIVRLIKGSKMAWERAIFPFQGVSFCAHKEDFIEVSEYTAVTTIRSDTIPCKLLSTTPATSNS